MARASADADVPHTLERRAGEAAARLPALLTEAERVAGALAAGAHGRARPGAGETFWQYRDHAPEDGAGAIDWRQSARSPGRHFVRQTEWETAASVHVWADGGDSFDYGSGAGRGGVTKRERAHLVACALAVLLVRAGERVGAFGGPARSGRAGVTALAERLVLGPNGTRLPDALPSRASRLVLLSDFHTDTDAVLGLVARLAATGRPAHLVQVSDPAEVTFPFRGRTVFRSPSGARRHGVQDAASVRNAYTARRAAHLDAIRDAAARAGLTFAVHVTDAPATPLLASLHAAMSQERRR